MMNINICDKCFEEQASDELIWIDSEDFTPKEGEELKKGAIENYTALCESCYFSELE